MKYYKLFLKRNEDTGLETLGQLNVDAGIQIVFHCVTLERPDKNNEKEISCIPKGVYDWIKVAATAKIPYTHISILNVPGRSGVCIHCANFYSQTEGCIVVGSHYVDINGDGQLDVIESKNTFEKLMANLPDNGILTIV